MNVYQLKKEAARNAAIEWKHVVNDNQPANALACFEVNYFEGGAVGLRLLRNDEPEEVWSTRVGVISARSYAEAMEALEEIRKTADSLSLNRVPGWSNYATAEAMERCELGLVINALPVCASAVYYARRDYEVLACAVLDDFICEIGDTAAAEFLAEDAAYRYDLLMAASGSGLWAVDMREPFAEALAALCDYQRPTT